MGRSAAAPARSASALGGAALLLDVEEGHRRGHGTDRAGLGAGDGERHALDRATDRQAGDGDGPVVERRIHRLGDDADLDPVLQHRRAVLRRHLALELEAPDPEALLALEPVMLFGAAEAGLARAHGEIEAQLPKRIARALVLERVHLGIVVGEEEQIALGAQQVERGEAARNDAHCRALFEDAVPDHRRVLAAHEQLVAALAGISRACDQRRHPEKRGGHVAEVIQAADARHVFLEEIDGERALQRQVMQIVVEADRDVAAGRGHRQLLEALARAMHHHEGIRRGAVDHAVVDELARIVEHAGIDGAARHQLLDVARGGAVDHVACRRPGDMDLLQARDIHQPGLRPDRHVLGERIAVVGPGGAHAAPVFQRGAERAVPVGQRRKSPRCGHVRFLVLSVVEEAAGGCRPRRSGSVMAGLRRLIGVLLVAPAEDHGNEHAQVAKRDPEEFRTAIARVDRPGDAVPGVGAERCFHGGLLFGSEAYSAGVTVGCSASG
ncbi:hypothetical protein SDC9_30435 [bioreactor metagenome]|uniref:Uncharacterized protein n=1 Tax=bioreactor metagenome TaxID=1076179 RepID=A0A644UZH2_9ZZZZ